MDWGQYLTILVQVILAILTIGVTLSVVITLFRSTLRPGPSRER